MLDARLARIADMSSSALWARWRALKALRERERVGDGGREGVAIVGHRGGIVAGRPKKHRGQS
jgi:hypothetical protein